MSNDIEKKLEQMGYEADDLDAVVNMAASTQAARVNNEGMSAQLRFLEQQGYSEDEIVYLLKAEQ